MENQNASKFVQQTVNRMKESSDQNIAERNEKKAAAAFKSQIAQQEGKLVDLEMGVSDAQQAMENAFYPTTMITSAESYLQGIKEAKRNLDNAEAALSNAKESIEFMKNALAEKF